MRLDGKYFFSPTDEFKNLDLNEFNQIVGAFERRIRGWFFEPLEKMLAKESELFIASAVECMLVDSLSGFVYGRRNTTNTDFTSFVRSELKFPEPIASAFYDRFRCGILHQTSIKEKSCISLELEHESLHLDDNNVLFFNPRNFYVMLRKYFAYYMEKLQQDVSTQINFREHFKHLFEKEYSPIEWIPWDKSTLHLRNILNRN